MMSQFEAVVLIYRYFIPAIVISFQHQPSLGVERKSSEVDETGCSGKRTARAFLTSAKAAGVGGTLFETLLRPL